MLETDIDEGKYIAEQIKFLVNNKYVSGYKEIAIFLIALNTIQ